MWARLGRGGRGSWLPCAIALLVVLVFPSGASAATGAITGTITDEVTGDGIPDACVETFDSGGTGIEVETDSDGHYTLSGLATGNYKLTFFSCFGGNYVQEWYANKDTFNAADTVPVTDGQTTPNINAALAHGGTITGTVTNDDGDPVQGIDVHANNATHGGSATTDANGDYTVTGLAAGSYTVRFFDALLHTYVTQYYNDTPTESAANPVSVTVENTTPDIDATLHRGGSISGTVTEEGTGAPLAHVCVAVYGPDANGDCVETDASGHYTYGKLESGSYKVSFIDFPGYQHEGEAYDNKPDLSSADPVGVAAGSDTPNIDAALAVDVTPPATHFTAGPVGSTTATSATIAFQANDGLATYECSLDGGAFDPCTSPYSVSGLGLGIHTFHVRASDPAGNVEDPPAGGSWTVVSGSSTTTGTAAPGGTVTTDGGGGPTPGEPVSTAVTSPTGGSVTITDTFATTQAPPVGYSVFGREVQITAPDATVASPLRLVFTIDASALPSGTDPNTLTIMRNAQPAGECPGSSTASPDPCVSARQLLAGGDLQLTVLTSHASYWNFVKPVPVPPPSPPATGTNPAPPATTPAKKKCKKKTKKRSAAAAKKCKSKKR
jgi:hypothetical protein